MGKCLPFSYGGCRGNQNKFDSAEECERRCAAVREEAAGEFCRALDLLAECDEIRWDRAVVPNLVQEAIQSFWGHHVT